MPLFVDHAGLNTLINDELDLETNTRLVPITGSIPEHPENRLARTQTAVQNLRYSISAPATANNFARLSNDNLPSEWGLAEGLFSTEFIFKLDNDSAVEERYFFETVDSNNSSSISLFLTGGMINFTYNVRPGGHLTGSAASASVNMQDFTSSFSTMRVRFNDWDDIAFYINNVELTPVNIDAPNSYNPADVVNTKLYMLDSAATTNNGELIGSVERAEFWDSNILVENNYLADYYFFSRDSYSNGSLTLGSEVGSGVIIASSVHAPAGNNVTSSGNLFLAEGTGYVDDNAFLYSTPGYVAEISESSKVFARNIHRNGPYGYSTWKQIRASQNPIMRHHKKNNKITFITQPGPLKNVLSNGELRVRDRYSALYSFTEPAVCQKAYPLVWNVGRHFKDEDGNVDMNNPNKFSIISSYGNQQISFANKQVDKLLKFDPDEEQTEYVAIKDMYLENGLNKADSPLTYWEFLQYRETVFPKEQQQFVNQVRNRPQFESFYRHNRENRRRLYDTGAFGFRPVDQDDIRVQLSQSTWPLDESEDFLTSLSGTTIGEPGEVLGYLNVWGEGELMQSSRPFTDEMVTYSSDLSDASLSNAFQEALFSLDSRLSPGPIYMRRISLANSQSVSNPSGMEIYGTSSTETLFQGGALWEAGAKRQIKDADGNYISAPKYPFYDTYDNYAEEVRKYGKNYAVIPEFRMSTQIEDFKRTGNEIELDMFEVTGGISGSENSSKTNFYEIYSNTDFMRNFEVIASDHEEFTNGKVLSMRCKAIKKFLPYEGFYPAQRTVDLAKRFYDSFKNNIKIQNANGVELSDFNYGRHMVMTPLFAPGVLFNTIKSGVAVDYPIITGSLDIVSSSLGGYVINNNNFSKRIPFEAIIEPKTYLANYKLTSNEPHPSGNLSASAVWDGAGDELYSMMANNFLAEVPEFFLPKGQFTSVVSKRQKAIRNFKVGEVYGMRIKMRRSMDKTRISVYHSGSEDVPYLPPQDIILTGSSACRETFTMYSRPSAFGPPCRSYTLYDNSYFILDNDRFIGSGALIRDSLNGFNFPFTPPYYHGEAWCQMWMTASKETMTIQEIQNSITSSFSRYEASYHLSNTTTNSILASRGTMSHGHLNSNAVQLSSSLNLFGFGTVKERDNLGGGGGSLVVDTGEQEENRWVIQTKFETPMLNFNHISGSEHLTLPIYGSGSVPRGMWHQYGRIPEENEGVFLEIEPIPNNYQEIVLERTEAMYDLADHLGFSGTSTKLGRIRQRKTISEAVVAVPFVEDQGRKKFFRLDPNKVRLYKEGKLEQLTQGEPSSQIGRSVLLQMDKMKKFIFPPSFDFLNFDEVTPVAMYIFEFSHDLTQQDLSDIWQNLPPDIGTEMEVAEVAITHPLLRKELLGQGGESGNATIEMPDKLKWMVFKVKQRAASNYFKKTVLRNPQLNTDVESQNATKDEFGETSAIQYNWPYDFFSLVEMVKIDAEVELGNIDFSNYTDVIPKWDAVVADREKIAYIVGGLEDDPIPETFVEEEVEEEEVSTQPSGPQPVDVEGLFNKFKELVQAKAGSSRNTFFGSR